MERVLLQTTMPSIPMENSNNVIHAARLVLCPVSVFMGCTGSVSVQRWEGCRKVCCIALQIMWCGSNMIMLT